jgi:hypothetical protein
MTPAGYDRGAMMREAHRLFRGQRRFDPDYTFGRAIKWAAHNARARRQANAMNEIAAQIEALIFEPGRYGRPR